MHVDQTALINMFSIMRLYDGKQYMPDELSHGTRKCVKQIGASLKRVYKTISCEFKWHGQFNLPIHIDKHIISRSTYNLSYICKK